jgi:hypothetical protein
MLKHVFSVAPLALEWDHSDFFALGTLKNGWKIKKNAGEKKEKWRENKEKWKE